MSKLREKQKAQRRELIELAAKNLFVEKGFELTSIEITSLKILKSIHLPIHNISIHLDLWRFQKMRSSN